MSDPSIQNLRIRFYGVHGSGSIFPSREERETLGRLHDHQLLAQVFDYIGDFANDQGLLNCTVEKILGGPPGGRMIKAFRSRFPDDSLPIYGGWTTCVWIETADRYDIVLDCGSGFRNCARDLQAKWGDRKERHLYLFGSHSHLDHTEGFDQAAVCFDPRNQLHILGNGQFLRALDANLGIFSRHVDEKLLGVHTPIFYGIMPTRFEATEIRDCNREPPPEEGDPMTRKYQHIEEPLQLEQTQVTAFEVNHPAPCLAYVIENNGRRFVFCTDHELRRGQDDSDPRQVASHEAEQRLIRQARGADLLYHDGQYLKTEYDGLKGVGDSAPVPRLDWGHSCIQDIQQMAVECQISRTLIGHHDPNREWSEREWIDQSLQRSSSGTDSRIELARAETVIDL